MCSMSCGAIGSHWMSWRLILSLAQSVVVRWLLILDFLIRMIFLAASVLWSYKQQWYDVSIRWTHFSLMSRFCILCFLYVFCEVVVHLTSLVLVECCALSCCVDSRMYQFGRTFSDVVPHLSCTDRFIRCVCLSIQQRPCMCRVSVFWRSIDVHCCVT